ncbi:HPr family phosphocarrier protein [Gracilibacillus marinus]|uniref:HPr family phosphocarrier protein n=1 Tax=Gracilibacillus marinus TaxID=630535 RepID=A0ABV8VUU5_9BACI
MYVKEIKVNRILGPKEIQELSNLAREYESDIKLQSKHYKIDVKSILGLLALNLGQGSDVTVIAMGEDDKEAMDAISAYLQSINV